MGRARVGCAARSSCSALAVPDRSPSPARPRRARIGFVAEWGEAGSGPGSSRFPVSVAVDGAGDVYVADSENEPHPALRRKRRLPRRMGRQRHRAGAVRHPRGGRRRRLRATSTSPTRATTGSRNSPPPAASSHSGAATAPVPGSSRRRRGSPPMRLGNVYVADAGNDRIEKFSSDRRLPRRVGRPPAKPPGQFNGPTASPSTQPATSTSPTRATTASRNSRQSGAFVAKWGKTGDRPRRARLPDRGRHRRGRQGLRRRYRQRPDRALRRLGQVPRRVGRPRQSVRAVRHRRSRSPSAAGGRVFVADAGNDRIQVFGKLSKPQYGKSVNLGVVSGVDPGAPAGLDEIHRPRRPTSSSRSARSSTPATAGCGSPPRRARAAARRAPTSSPAPSGCCSRRAASRSPCSNWKTGSSAR